MEKFKETMRNLPINRKMKRSIGVVTLVAVVIGVILLAGMQYISSNIKGIFEGPMTNISDVGDVKYALTDLQRAINRVIAEGEGNRELDYDSFEQTVETDVDMVKTAVSSMEKRFTTDAGIAKLEELQSKIDEGEQIRPELMSLLKEGKIDEAYDLNYSSYLPVVNEIKALTEELETIINSNGQNYYVSSLTISQVLFVVGVALVIFLLIFSTYLMKLVTNVLSEPIKQMEEAAELMMNGDMSAWQLITYHSEDELGSVAHSLRRTMKNLHDYIAEISEVLDQVAKGDLTKNSDDITDFLGDFVSIKQSFVMILKNFNKTLNSIQETSEQVESGSQELSKAAGELSNGATDQASAVEELTATIETVASLSEKSATQTQEAYDNILQAAAVAEDERQKMDSLTAAMKDIIDISKKIEEIVSSIEDIASQTSLLALNASIEAARAGEAGKGFAVVAEQIGKLASDSSASAVNTRELIGKTMEEINKGNDITASVAVAFEQTIDEMQKFAGVAKSTNEAAKDQAEALAQIESGIEQISGVTQSTAASTQESSAISEQLAQRANELDHLVNRFKLYSEK